MLYVENLPSIDIPEIMRVELPRDDSVVITGVSEADVPAKVSRQFATCISTFYINCFWLCIELQRDKSWRD